MSDRTFRFTVENARTRSINIDMVLESVCDGEGSLFRTVIDGEPFSAWVTHNAEADGWVDYFLKLGAEEITQ